MSLSVKLWSSSPLLALADGCPGAHMTTVESLSSGTRLPTGLGSSSRGAQSSTANFPSPGVGSPCRGAQSPTAGFPTPSSPAKSVAHRAPLTAGSECVAVTPSPLALSPAIVTATNCWSRLRRVASRSQCGRFGGGGLARPVLLAEVVGLCGTGTCVWMNSCIVEELKCAVRVPDRDDTADNLDVGNDDARAVERSDVG